MSKVSAIGTCISIAGAYLVACHSVTAQAIGFALFTVANVLLIYHFTNPANVGQGDRWLAFQQLVFFGSSVYGLLVRIV